MNMHEDQLRLSAVIVHIAGKDTTWNASLHNESITLGVGLPKPKLFRTLCLLPPFVLPLVSMTGCDGGLRAFSLSQELCRCLRGDNASILVLVSKAGNNIQRVEAC